MAGRIITGPFITPGILDVGLIWTSDDIVSLRSAIASGVSSVSYAGPPQRSVTYQSTAEMQALLTRMILDVYGRRRWRRVRVRKGFRDDDTDTE